MRYVMKEMTIGEVLDVAVNLVKDNFKPLFMITLYLLVPAFRHDLLGPGDVGPGPGDPQVLTVPLGLVTGTGRPLLPFPEPAQVQRHVRVRRRAVRGAGRASGAARLVPGQVRGCVRPLGPWQVRPP